MVALVAARDTVGLLAVGRCVTHADRPEGGGPHGGHTGRRCSALRIQDGIRLDRPALPSSVWRAEKMSPETRVVVNNAEQFKEEDLR